MFSTIRNIMAFIAIIVILLVWLIQDKRKASSIIIAYAILACFLWLTIIFPPESLLVGFSSEQSAYYYISGKGNNDNTTKIDGKSSTLVIELTDNGAVTPYLLIKKEYKWYITSGVIYSFHHIEDCWNIGYSVYCLSHPLIDETYWMIYDESDCVNSYGVESSSKQYDSGVKLEYVDDIGRRVYWFFCTENEEINLYVNNQSVNNHYVK
jgi:hypothetical protein